MKYHKKINIKIILVPICILLSLFLRISIISQDISSSVEQSVLENLIALQLYNDSMLISTNNNDSIIIPYRSMGVIEKYPAQSLYKIWTSEFLTPLSFNRSQIPDKYEINLEGFYFPSDGIVTSKFGMRNKRPHYGIDLKIKMHDTIRAAFDGKVRLEKYEPRGYGYYMVIRHNNGLETIYAHLSKYLVKVNQHVIAGEPIALGNNTGRSSGTHLHFETRFMGNPIDPSSLVDFNSKSLLSQSYVYNTPNRQIKRSRK